MSTERDPLALAAEAEELCASPAWFARMAAPAIRAETTDRMRDLLLELAGALRRTVESAMQARSAYDGERIAFYLQADKRIAALEAVLKEAHGWIAQCTPLDWCAHGTDPRVFEDAACMDQRGHEILNRIDAVLAEKGGG